MTLENLYLQQDLNLQQVFVDDREKSTIFRPVTKFSFIFKNQYTGSTSYLPYKNNLYYTNEIQNAISALTISNFAWEGYPQYTEFDFIRNDNDISGYTTPPNNHLNFINKSASTYNWTHYMSYGFENDYYKPMYAYDTKTTASWSWTASDGIPFIIDVGSEDNQRVISFRSVMKHGLSIGEYVQLSFDYNDEYFFQVGSLGDNGYGSEEFIFNIGNVGYTGTTFNKGNTGYFKRVINKNNSGETTSEYYVRRNKILTSVEDSLLNNAGFEQNIFNTKIKYETSALTPNHISRTSVKEGSQAYSLSFNTDIDIAPLRDNQNRPISELFFTTIWKGYFGWTNPLKQGYRFNLPLNNGKPNSWWGVTNLLSNTNLSRLTYTSNTIPPVGLFGYNKDLMIGDIIDGDYCEWNSYDQTERVISNLYHKFTFNNLFFTLKTNASQKNQYGYYYKPHNPIIIRRYSDYIEEGDPNTVVGIPDYSFYSNLSGSFRWRDLYPYGYVDPDGIGVDYPFINGKHYPFVNTIFRLIPEGTITENEFIDNIVDPIIDECE